MIDTRYIHDLLGILKTQGVKSFKTNGLELEFHIAEIVSSPARTNWPTDPPLANGPDSTQIIADALKKQEEAMPIDLRADSLMDHDKVLNWSSPDQSPDQPELPLTGEAPL